MFGAPLAAKGAPQLVTGPSPRGPEFLHNQHQGIGDRAMQRQSSVPFSSDCHSRSEDGDDTPEVEVVWAKAARGFWEQGHVFGGKL